MDDPKQVVWIGSSRKDLKDFPEDVQDEMGHALYQVQLGLMPLNAKPLRGFGGAKVLEMVEDYDTDTFRAVYTVKFAERVYVLHSFQKKSTQGIKTSKQDLNLIERRLRVAEEMHKLWIGQRIETPPSQNQARKSSSK